MKQRTYSALSCLLHRLAVGHATGDFVLRGADCFRQPLSFNIERLLVRLNDGRTWPIPANPCERSSATHLHKKKGYAAYLLGIVCYEYKKQQTI